MKCPKCGAVIPDGSRFCNICGEKVNIPRPERHVNSEAIRPRDEDFDIAPTVRKKNDRTDPEDHDQKDWVIILILVAALLAAFIGVAVFRSLKKNLRTNINIVTPTDESETEETTTTLAPSSEKPTETKKESEEETTEETESSEEKAPEEESSPEETVPESTTEAPTETAVESTTAEDPGEDREYGGVIYHLANGQATLLKCYSADAVMEMPAQVYGFNCVTIAPEAFKDCTHLTHIDLPEGYQRIGENAFYNCKNLKEIVIPDSVTQIDGGAFDYCGRFTVISHKDTFAYALATNNNIPWTEGTALTIYAQ